MKIRIAAPSNPVFDPLFANISDVKRKYDVEFYRLPEKEVQELFASGRADAAFLSPLAYGTGIKKGDYRIVPSTCFASQGYTLLASVFFRKGLDTVRSIASPDADDFIIKTGNYLLGEMYGIDLQVKSMKGSAADLLQVADAAVMWNREGEEPGATDISEDWTEHSSVPLILGAWVVRNEEEPVNIFEITSLMAGSGAQEETKTGGNMEEGEMIPREGRLIYHWNEELETAMDEILEFLYYRQAIPDFASVKIMGNEYGDTPAEAVNKMADSLLGDEKDRSGVRDDEYDYDGYEEERYGDDDY